MSKKDEVLIALVNLSKGNPRGVEAKVLSKYLDLDRTNISRYLNQLYKENKVERIEGRPVLYKLIKDNGKEEKIKSDDKSKVEVDITTNKNCLSLMVGATRSLQIPIQQAKAAILYPPRGLHTLVLGETGVGKSMFAELMYQFAKESGVLAEDAPFVRFNCADYADNPQLVVAQIFGVKKGTFTGADSDRDGLLKKADTGILFLDEIHRLSPQGQEMLFTYIDKGIFRPLGETEKTIKVEAQIIAATTEDPQSNLLKTFTRRIPMTITLPPLRERHIKERYYLLVEFLKQESKRLNKSIYINKNSLVSFLLYDCPNNIGQLKSDIQLCSAKAFLNYKTQNREYILIDQAELHSRVKKGIMNIQENREEIDKLLNGKPDVLRFSYSDDDEMFIETFEEMEEYSKSEPFYNHIEKKLNLLKSKGLDENEISELINKDIEGYFQKYINDLPIEFRKEELSKVVDIAIINIVEKILNSASSKLRKNFDEKVFFGLALHLQGSIERIKQGNRIYHPNLNDIRTQYPDEFFMAMESAKILDEEFNIKTPLDEIGYLTMFLSSKPYDEDVKKEGNVKILVIMHGNSTATSMVEVVNTLIGEKYAEALDMPLNMKAQDMYGLAKEKITEIHDGKGVLLLVDMGSLVNFGDMIGEELGIVIKTIDMVSTPIVLDATRKALSGRDISTIYNSCMELCRYGINIVTSGYVNKKRLIVTACYTGEGSSERLKEIIENKLEKRSSVDIIPLNILDRDDFFRKIDSLKEDYNILAIVGTVNISVDNIVFISAPEILTGEGLIFIDKLIKEEETYENMKSALKNHIDIKNIDEFVYSIRSFLVEIQQTLGISLSLDNCIGILMHMSFMVDRIKKGDKEPKFKELNKYKDLHGRDFILIKQNLRKLELKYGVSVGENDLAFIVRMIVENAQCVTV